MGVFFKGLLQNESNCSTIQASAESVTMVDVFQAKFSKEKHNNSFSGAIPYNKKAKISLSLPSLSNIV